jgi:hypothetical protein
MVERERDTVVVDGDRSSSGGWLVALIVIGLLVLLFFLFGGMNMFGGNNSTEDGSSTGTDTINVDTPDNINVQPTAPTPTTDTSSGQ